MLYHKIELRRSWKSVSDVELALGEFNHAYVIDFDVSRADTKESTLYLRACVEKASEVDELLALVKLWNKPFKCKVMLLHHDPVCFDAISLELFEFHPNKSATPDETPHNGLWQRYRRLTDLAYGDPEIAAAIEALQYADAPIRPAIYADWNLQRIRKFHAAVNRLPMVHMWPFDHFTLYDVARQLDSFVNDDPSYDPNAADAIPEPPLLFEKFVDASRHVFKDHPDIEQIKREQTAKCLHIIIEREGQHYAYNVESVRKLHQHVASLEPYEQHRYVALHEHADIILSADPDSLVWVFLMHDGRVLPVEPGHLPA